MKRFFSLPCLATMFLLLPAIQGHAAGPKLTAKQLNRLDKLGAFPADFKEAVHDYVKVVQEQEKVQNEEKKLKDQIPGLDQDAANSQSKLDALHVELADYDHTDETDFVVLQTRMNDQAAKPNEKLTLAQVFVWSYPTSSHLGDAQTFLQQIQKQIADVQQAEKDAAAAKAAAWAKLLQRVHDHDLSLAEWSEFLGNMTQDDVVKYLGSPQQSDAFYWRYAGEWTLDPNLRKKVGLQLNFNGGRVIGVVGTSPPAANSGGAPASRSE